MARRAFRRGAAAITQKRLTRWIGIAPVSTVVTAVGGTIVFSLAAPELALRPFTIVRTRLQVAIQSDQAAASELVIAAMGVCVVSDQALAIGVTAVPTPITDIDSDLWFVHQVTYNNFVFGDGTGFIENNLAQYDVDSKAMRKVQDGQDVAVVAELSGISGGGANLIIGGRMLIKLN